MTASRWSWTKTGVALTVSLALLWTIGVGDGASARPHPASPVVAPRVSSTHVCDGTLAITFDTTQLVGRQWVPLQDDGSTLLEGHEVSGRSGPTGAWVPLSGVTSGGEHALRWSGWKWSTTHGQHFDLVRVVSGGYRSVAYPILQECTP